MTNELGATGTEPKELDPPRTSWASHVIPIGLAALLFAIPFTAAFESAMHFAGTAIDGPFQLYNALRRIGGGFRPGIDFQFFHWLGVPYLHYWLYRLLGRGLRGSELARQMLSAVAYLLVFVTLFRAFTGDWRRTWYLTAAALAVSMALKMPALYAAQNGMLGVRSSLPTVLPAVWYLVADRRTRVIATGLTLGVAAFVSTEQGIAAALAYCLVSIVVIVAGGNRRVRSVETAAVLGLAVVTLLVALLAVGGPSGAAGAVRYNLQLVPLDQYWYFGTPPNDFISSWTAAPRMFARARQFGVAVAVAPVVALAQLRRAWRARDEETDAERRQFALTWLAVYGVISCAALLGIFTRAYMQPCLRVLIVLGLLELTRRTDLLEQRRSASNAPRNSPLAIRWPAAMALVSVVWMLLVAPTVRPLLLVSLPHVVRDHLFGGARFGISGFWAETLREGQRVLDERRGPDGQLPSLWSTYAGWLEARNGIFHPSFDYIIHALGEENRASYLERFRAQQPRVVQTVLPTNTLYETWIESTSWDFYQELLSKYALVAKTPWSFCWERQPVAGPQPRLLAVITPSEGTHSIRLPAAPASGQIPVTLLIVEVAYQTRNPLRRLPLLGASPRYLIGLEGAVMHTPVTLDPYKTMTRFPLVVVPGTAASLAFQTFSLLPGASYSVRSLRVFVLPVDPRNSPWLMDIVRQQESEFGPLPVRTSSRRPL